MFINQIMHSFIDLLVTRFDSLLVVSFCATPIKLNDQDFVRLTKPLGANMFVFGTTRPSTPGNGLMSTLFEHDRS